jgi:GT2 family glycosyltransferase
MTHDLPLVTAVILNWNGREYLADCLDSLRGLDYPRERLEVLLVDNGSVDESAAYVREQYPEVRLIELPQNVGSCVARNLGVREAEGEYIALLDNDAHVEAEWLKTLVAAVQADPKVVCASSRLMNLAGDRVEFGGSSINFYGYGYQEGYDRGNVAAYTGTHPTIFPCIGAALIRREVYLEAGGLDEDYFIYYEDVDLGWRLWVLGYKVMYVGTAVALHKHHGTQHQMPDASRRVLFERNAMLTWIKNYDEEHLARVWPAGLLLAIERLYLMTGLDPQTYRLGARAPKAAPARRQIKGAPWFRLWRDRGIVEVWRQAQTAIRRKLGKADPIYPPPDRVTLPGPEPGYDQVSHMALAHLVALHDVIDLLPRTLEKRAKIQAARRRSDEEIFELFGRALEISFYDPTYEAVQNQLVQLLGLDRIFYAKGPSNF